MHTLAPKRVGNALIERANVEDVPSIKRIVDIAYSKYIERLGKKPAPMSEDYAKLVATQNVYVLRAKGEVIGAIYLSKEGDSMKIHNLVVDPLVQGFGYGRALMDYAEDMARAQGLLALTLYTNEKMYENIVLYPKIGFAETERRTEDGFNRVFYRRTLI